MIGSFQLFGFTTLIGDLNRNCQFGKPSHVPFLAEIYADSRILLNHMTLSVCGPPWIALGVLNRLYDHRFEH